jgi:XTP/dITP diphosphohydrolase
VLFPPGLVLATHNPGKLAEWRALLGPLDGAADLGVLEPDETGATFLENALLKARAACQATGRPCLAEDAGLVLSDGEPGVRTARFMKEAGGWREGMSVLLTRPDRAASYVCALAVVFPDGTVVTTQAHAKGRIAPPAGVGPGVSAWFYPQGFDTSWAELVPDWRCKYDHRALAIAGLSPIFSLGDRGPTAQCDTISPHYP